MKSKLLLYLALVLSVGLWIWFNSHEQMTRWFKRELNRNPTVVRIIPEGTWSKKLKLPWADTKIVLYRTSGEVVLIDAKKAVYTVWSTKVSTNQPQGIDYPVVAFIDPATQNVWIGAVNSGDVETNEFVADEHTIYTNYLTYTNFYIENDSEILSGSSVLADGTFDGCESVIKKALPGEGLDSVIGRYDNSADTAWPPHGASWFSNFRGDFREDFFSSGNLGSQSTQIKRLEVADGKLRLDFDSLKYRTAGNVWLDLKTMKVLKTVEHK